MTFIDAVVFVLFIFSVIVHEVAHGWVAYRMGDPTAKEMGRLTLNPVPHIDLFMTILLPAALHFLSNGAFMFGGAKPVPVDARRLRNPRRGLMLVSLAGPASNVLLAVMAAAVFRGILAETGTTVESLAVAQTLTVCMHLCFLNLFLALFNLIPVPPLDGGRVVTGLLPYELACQYARIEPYGLMVVLALVYTNATEYLAIAAHFAMRAMLAA